MRETRTAGIVSVVRRPSVTTIAEKIPYFSLVVLICHATYPIP